MRAYTLAAAHTMSSNLQQSPALLVSRCPARDFEMVLLKLFLGTSHPSQICCLTHNKLPMRNSCLPGTMEPNHGTRHVVREAPDEDQPSAISSCDAVE